VNSFCPDGYVPAGLAIAEALKYWFSHRLDAIQILAAANAAGIDIDAPAGAPSRSPSWEAWQQVYRNLWLPTVERLRKHLSQGNLIRAYYFGIRPGDRREVPPPFWERPETSYTLESGIYFPVGRPDGWLGPSLNCQLFFRKAELALLLSELQSPKTHFPDAKKPALVAAIQKLSHLTRKAQRKVLVDLPDFRAYLITDDVFLEAAKQVPRPRGRPRKPSSG
jgi:hypothetical protein